MSAVSYADNEPARVLDLSFVVIGFNESATLPACFRSIQEAELEGLAVEIIYVDGGSTDTSIEIARSWKVDACLGGEKRRRAAENRNLGLRHARGEFVQFLDGDMQLEPGWIQAGLALLRQRPGTAVVWGYIREANPGPYYRAMQLDWEFVEGPTRYCGGAALFRRGPLASLGGFPEDVAYGEEPYLCWRIRNELDKEVYHLHEPMVQHDLAYGGLRDYARRTVRCGETYAEIAARCLHTKERLWLREVVTSLGWASILVIAILAAIAGAGAIQLAAAAFLAAVLGRKFLQYATRGRGMYISLVYALHTYATKLLVAYGILRWLARRRR